LRQNLLNTLLAAIIHVISELAFIPNSARLLPGDSNRETVVVQK